MIPYMMSLEIINVNTRASSFVICTRHVVMLLVIINNVLVLTMGASKEMSKDYNNFGVYNLYHNQ